MNWSELTAKWNQQSAPAFSRAELTALETSFESERRRLASRLFWRDIREAGASGLASGFLIVVAVRWGRAAWPIAAAAAVGLGVAAFFVRERLRVGRARRGPGAPLLAKLEADLAELRHQRRLLTHVGRWLLGPIVTSWAVVVVAAVIIAPGHGSNHPLFLGGYVAVSFLVFWGVWIVNRQAVKRSIDPRIAELEALKRDIETVEE